MSELKGFKFVTTLVLEFEKIESEDKTKYDSDSVIDYTISKYNLLAGSCYTKLPKELDHPRKGLINIQDIDDNDCFKVTNLDFKDIIFAVKLETFTKLKKRIPLALVFVAMKK